ncbi:MAG: hypothetical protein WC700_02535 [Gemmatimonadaceae bacterium]
MMVALLMCPTSAIGAQAGIAADVAVGTGSGSGQPNAHGGALLDVAVSVYRLSPLLRPFITIARTTEGLGPRGDGCWLVPSGACLGPLTFRSVSALVGADLLGQGLSAGAAVGPTVYVSNEQVTAAGLQVRFQLVTPSKTPAAFVVSGRYSWLPNYRNSTYQATAVTLGLRLRSRSRF